MKSFDAILNAVMMELQRTQGATFKLTLEIEAEAPGGPTARSAWFATMPGSFKFNAEFHGL